MKVADIRQPAVAGKFYPDSPDELRAEVRSYIAHGIVPSPLPVPKAMIAPHAGYIYSGPIAGSAYACLKSQKAVIKRVILLGPSHRVAFKGIAGSSMAAFNTPLGDVPVDRSSCEEIADLPGMITFDLAHRDEHGLEVHLPFLQETLEDFSIVPLVVGDAKPQDVATIIEHVWGGPETLIVVSSDLSHYLTYDEAARIDRRTSKSIEQLDAFAIGFDHACGRIPVQGLILEAQSHRLIATTLDLRNSGDTAGDKRQVVGYGAYVFTST